MRVFDLLNGQHTNDNNMALSFRNILNPDFGFNHKQVQKHG